MTAPVLSDYLDRVDRPAHDGATIRDAGHANYVLRKYAEAQQALAAVDAQWDPHIAAIEQAMRDTQQRRQDAAREILSDLEFRRGQLHEWAAKRLADDPDTKTLTFPAGRIRSRTDSSAAEIADVGELLGAAERWGIVSRTPKVLVSDVRKHVTVTDGGKVVDSETGEVVPGLSVREGTTTFQVVTDGGGS